MIQLRKSTIHDVNFVKKCIDELESTVFDEEAFFKVYSSVLSSAVHHSFIIEFDKVPCGYLGMSILPLIHHCGNVAEIQELVVLPEFRNKAIGKFALECANHYAKENNCVLIELASNKKRTDAHRFYETNGYSNSHFKLTFSLDAKKA